MKKLFAILLSVYLLAALSVTAFAANINEDSSDKTGGTSVTYDVAPTYTVTIPATVTLGNEVTISADNVVVPKGTQVEVKLTGTSETDNSFKVKSVEGAELSYTIKKNETSVSLNDTVLTVNPSSSAAGSTSIKFELNDNVKYAGTYTGTVTFTVSVENAS